MNITENNKENKEKNINNENKLIINEQTTKKKRKMKSLFINIQKEANIIINNNNNDSIGGTFDIINNQKINKNIMTEDNCSQKITNNNKNQNKINKIKMIMEFTDKEINLLSYELALKNDKRTYCQYYISLLKTNHDFIFSFLYNKDYNSKIIKIDLFVIGFAMNYTVNAFFLMIRPCIRYIKEKAHLIWIINF